VFREEQGSGTTTTTLVKGAKRERGEIGLSHGGEKKVKKTYTTKKGKKERVTGAGGGGKVTVLDRKWARTREMGGSGKKSLTEDLAKTRGGRTTQVKMLGEKTQIQTRGFKRAMG